MPRLSFALENLKNIQEMIRFADTKAGAILVVYGFIITLYVEIGKDLAFGLTAVRYAGIGTFIFGVLAGASILFEVSSILLKIIKPRLAQYDENEKCLYYFEHIALCTRTELLDSLNVDENTKISEIAAQIHENAKILSRKLAAIKSATNRLLVSGPLVIAYGVAAKFLTT